MASDKNATEVADRLLSEDWSASAYVRELQNEQAAAQNILFILQDQELRKLEPLIKVRLLLAPLFLRKQERDRLKDSLQVLADKLCLDDDEWVKVTAYAVGRYEGHLDLAAVSKASRQRYHEQAEKTAAGFVERLQEMALAMPQMCCALYLQALNHPRQVIVAGAPDAPETQALLAAAHGSFAPDRLVLPIDPANQASKVWYQQHNPEAWAMVEGATKEAGAAARAFVCQNFTCRAPTTDPQVLRQLMNESPSTGPPKSTLTEFNPVKLTR